MKFLSALPLAFAAFCITSLPAPAHATKKVYSPYVEAGELEIEWKGGYDVDGNNAVDGGWKQKLGVGYGVNDFWFTEVEAEVEKDGTRGADTDFSALEWENKFMLTPQGQYFVDVGALAAVEYNTSGGADKAELKLLLAKDTGPWSHLLNVSGEREFGDHSGHDTEFGLAWGSRYRYSPAFEPGFEIHSNFGSLSDGSDFDAEDHRIGPVVYGKLGAVKYDVGYLFGASDGAPDGTLKAILEYEMRF
ncbi:MAG: hypothetical protein KDI46_03570 [Alphaproteobacteria bacterium]|nr:hypothetical protein [Alphaproteobacteria bacterium]